MKTQKEKAIELIDKLLNVDYTDNSFFGAKECALIVVDEIINSSPSAPILSNAGSFVNDIEESTEWWKEVKQEIINL